MMKRTSSYSPNEEPDSENQDNFIPIDLKPKFDQLRNPKVIIDHVNDLKNPKVLSSENILSRLLEEIKILDFESLANPHNAENFKLNRTHYLIYAIENIIETARKNRFSLCKNNSFIYLFNGAFWDEVNKESMQYFFGKAAEKMGVPKNTVKHYKFKEELYKQFLGTAYLDTKLNLPNEVLINLKNGTFEITPQSTQLRPFDRSDFLTYQLPFEYDPSAEAPIFKSYLDRVLPDIACQKVLAEYLGYVFIKHGSNRLKEEKALILYGTGANGKSVFFEIVSALLGDDNTCNFSLQNLTNENGYYRAKLANKLVNYASEINGKLESSIFKQLVSGEPVEARLPYGEPFTLKQYAKLIFNCNELPRDVEQTNAYFRRFLIIPFDVTIPPEEQDKELHIKIITNELSGVFNWVIDGLNRLLAQNKFTDCFAAKSAVEQYKTQSDSVKMFIAENNYKSSPSEFLLIKSLYHDYRTFCQEDGFKPVNKSNFKKRLESTGIIIERLNVGNVAYLSKKVSGNDFPE